ncbi:HAMP domain-containing sensor histidine kinase [Polyangium sp. 15x6]|uniref:sensor histidine kinase n=1 Tax=Polyangium sp. 15x6 TaxID=3042687 RepID=UPI00249CEF2A|nr:HAMP domain-containing sensor histidine kinase [Polyangium sp. 15x6]MDI3288992.1 HAMP domain-containing sensor histidine kinase [Polyangium sp. 15x6]
MSALSAFAFYPVWALALLVGFVSLRLGRSRGYALPLLCFAQGVWVTGLVLFTTPGTSHIAERVLPSGIVQGAGFIHAAEALAGKPRRKLVAGTWMATGAFAALGAVAPRLLYGPGARGIGPAFVPFAVLGVAAAVAMLAYLAARAQNAAGDERGALFTLLGAAVLGCLGGGGTISAFILGIGPLWIAAPLMLGSTLLAAHATLGREQGKARALVRSGIVYAVLTASVSAVFATGYALALPYLVPAQGSTAAFVAGALVVTFFAALPFDPLRQIVVDGIGRRVARDPIGVRDLAEAVDRSEARADQAERLAEMGRIVSAVAHEIRNPLGVMLAQAKILERRGADPETLAGLRQEIANARRFLDDLLRYGKPRPLDLAVAPVLAEVTRAAEAARAAFGDLAPPVDVTGDAALSAELDRAALGDVVKVLVHNALVALSTAGGGGRVRIEVTSEGDETVVRVTDDGPGVPVEIEPRLFEPFVTGRGRDASHPGTGLGLAIAARWTERHGGSLRHERPPEGGARFIARFPTTARVVNAAPMVQTRAR